MQAGDAPGAAAGWLRRADAHRLCRHPHVHPRDIVLDVSGVAVLAEVMEDARIDIMPGVGHLPMLESPEETAARYLEFIGVPEADGS